MGLRFYRRVPIIPGLLWLNISKTGFSFSIGSQGWRLTRNRNGTLFTVGLSGTGLFWTKFFSKRNSNANDPNLPDSPEKGPPLPKYRRDNLWEKKRND
jgi:hypothetical protein